MKPKRVKIINARLNDSEYYSKFVGTEYDVLSISEDRNGELVELPIKSEFGGDISTYWYEGEYKVVQWAEDDNKLEPSETTKSILKGLDEAIGDDKVIISKDRYDELLEYEKLHEERLVYESVYKDKKIEEIL